MSKIKKVILGLFVCLCVCVLSVFAFAENEPDGTACQHLNTREETIMIQEADCYHVEKTETKVYCADCNEYLYSFYTVSSDVKHGEIEVIDESVPATCLHDGWIRIKRRCTVCGQIVSGATQPISGYAHTTTGPDGTSCYETRIEEIPATCTENGKRDTIIWCNVCKEEADRTSETIPATGHKWGEWREQDGKNVRVCSECGEKEEKPVENEPEEEPVVSIVSSIRNLINMIRNFFTKLFSFFNR